MEAHFQSFQLQYNQVGLYTIASANPNRYGNLSAYNTRLITPPSEEEEVYPYRRVWFSIASEMGLFFAVTIGLLIVVRVVSLPDNLVQILNLVLALLPLGLWLVFSWWREKRVLEPRSGLLTIVIVAGLAANGVGNPIITELFQVERWLPLESAINRIIGYTFTVGLVQSMIIYLVIRYAVWPTNFRIRLDGIAYGSATAVGYATALNIQFIRAAAATPDVTAMNIFGHSALLLCGGIIIGYGLAEVGFNARPFPLLLTATLAFAALITGIAIPLIAGFANTSISVSNPVSTVSPIQGFLFTAGLLGAVSFIFNFLFNVAENQLDETSFEETESLGP